MSQRIYWGCTTFHCERGFYGTEEDMPRDRKTCPACGDDLAEITQRRPEDADLDLPCDQGVGLLGVAFVLAVIAAVAALAVAVGLTLA